MTKGEGLIAILLSFCCYELATIEGHLKRANEGVDLDAEERQSKLSYKAMVFVFTIALAGVILYILGKFSG